MEIEIQRIATKTDGLPLGSVVQLYRVFEYTVQIGYVETGQRRDKEGTLSRGIAFSVCTCDEGFTNLPLSLAGLRPRVCCHVDQVINSLAKEVVNELV